MQGAFFVASFLWTDLQWLKFLTIPNDEDRAQVRRKDANKNIFSGAHENN
jgi:hypothetical protein